MNIDTERVKEYWRLCWEYLKRSDKYKELCDKVYNYIYLRSRENKELCVKIYNDMYLRSGKDKGLCDSICTQADMRDERCKLICYEKDLTNQDLLDSPHIAGQYKGHAEYNNVLTDEEVQLLYNYAFLGDIYRLNFDDWWEHKKGTGDRANAHWFKDALQEYSPTREMIEGIDNFINSYENSTSFIDSGREPTLQELKEHLHNQLNQWGDLPKLGCYLKIDLFPSRLDTIKSTTEIVKVLKGQFEKILTAKYKGISLMTPKRIRVDELEKYLKVYDYRKQGLKWEDIIGEFGENYIEPTRIEFLRFHKKAKKIISNIEQGIFPGQY